MALCNVPKSLPYSFYDAAVPLPPIYHRMSRMHLNETSEHVWAHLESFRRWIKSKPEIECPTDDVFLLAFLRHAKFNHFKAQKRLHNFCIFRNSEEKVCAKWFSPGLKRAELWEGWMRNKHFIPLGMVHDGTFVGLIKSQNIEIGDFTQEDMNTASQIWNDYQMMDERIQIAGMIFLMDVGGLKQEKATKMEDSEQTSLSSKYFQKCLPVTVKKLIYFNAPRYAEFIFRMISPWFNDETMSTMMILHDDLTPAFDLIPGLKALIPQEYGGNRKRSFDEIFDLLEPSLRNVCNKTAEIKVSWKVTEKTVKSDEESSKE